MPLIRLNTDHDPRATPIVKGVSMRKRQQQDKNHLNKLAQVTRSGLMGGMAAGIAHEVNQPLTAVATYAQVSLNIIKAKNPDLGKLAEIIAKTQQQALIAGQIIHRMKSFANAHVKHCSMTDINALIYSSVDLCRTELKQNNIKLIFELKDNLPAVYVDKLQIEQAIINLIQNSIDVLKSLPDTKQRLVFIHSVLERENIIQIRVKDNGPGLDKEQQQKIFMPFYTTRTDGMGMGLSISRSLIEAHEGTLRFMSEAGKGATFYFTLPVGKEAMVQAACS